MCSLLIQQQNHAGDTEGKMSHRPATPTTDSPNLQDMQEEDTEGELVNGKVVKSNSEAHLSTPSGTWLRCYSSSLDINN